MSNPAKILRYNSAFLGWVMFWFGLLKLIEPFRTQFNVQITNSRLPRVSIPMGIVGEISIGLSLLSAARLRRKHSPRANPLTSAASAALIANMAGATYVHLHPGVPAEVLPLRIKPPFIPLLCMCLAAVNVLAVHRDNASVQTIRK
ncbi:hypothetical protein [Mycobacterium sp. pR1184]|uniref:hypothetical protein n=1 Tax=Mycobacterium sp. pR1184 TaxID=3238981 RepID=UPI00351B53C0